MMYKRKYSLAFLILQARVFSGTCDNGNLKKNWLFYHDLLNLIVVFCI